MQHFFFRASLVKTITFAKSKCTLRGGVNEIMLINRGSAGLALP